MRTRHSSSRTAVALSMASSLALFPFLDVVRAQAPAATKPAAKAPATAQQPVDGGWPKAFNAPSGATVVMYQPQVSSWTNQRHIVAYSAVGYEKKGAEKPTLGSVKIESDTSVALDERLVHFNEFKLTEVNFEKLDRDETKEVTTEIDKAIPDGERVIALDRVLAFVDKSTIMPKNVRGLNADPPKIFFSTDAGGPRQLRRRSDLEPDRGERSEVRRQHQLGPVPARADEDVLPAQRQELAERPRPRRAVDASRQVAAEFFERCRPTTNFKEVKARGARQDAGGQRPPTGQRQHAAGRDDSAARRAELSAGRGHEGSAVGLRTPRATCSVSARPGRSITSSPAAGSRRPDFTGPVDLRDAETARRLQEDPARASIARACSRRCLAPTQAIEAVLLAQVPQTARVNRARAEGAGGRLSTAPRSSSRSRARRCSARSTPTRTSSRSATSTTAASRACGSWRSRRTARGRSRRRFPRRSTRSRRARPSHHVTYVTVEEDDEDNDEWVTFAYVAGYTGHDDRLGLRGVGQRLVLPALRRIRRLPIYYPGFRTYGYAAGYNPWTGAYGRGAVAYGPYGGVGAGARYNPRTGTYSRGAAAWGPYGAAGAGSGLQPAHRRRTARRDKARTSTAAGDRPPSSAATIGR